MNLAYYVLIFDYATDRFLPMIGLGGDYRDRTDCSTFAVETHTNYLLEVMAGTRVRCTTQLLGFDEKRLHYFHRMLREDDGALSATTEVMAVHVDLSVRKVRPMPEDVQGRLGRLFLAHSGLERPREVGHVMRLGGGRGN